LEREALPRPLNPFAAILEEIMNLGGFAKGAGVIVVTASLAAIMSNANLLIIAMVEIIYPNFRLDRKGHFVPGCRRCAPCWVSFMFRDCIFVFLIPSYSF
jgi:hypothetical protein